MAHFGHELAVFKKHDTSDSNVVVIIDKKIAYTLTKGNYGPAEYNIFTEDKYATGGDFWWMEELFVFEDFVDKNEAAIVKAEQDHDAEKMAGGRLRRSRK
jgi:hypothetical protein